MVNLTGTAVADRRPRRRRHRYEDGQSLVVVLGLVTILFLIGTALAAQASGALRAAAANGTEAGALDADDAGAELGIWWQRNAKSGSPPTITVNGIAVTTTVATSGSSGGNGGGPGTFTDFCMFGAGDGANGNTTSIGSGALVHGLAGGNRTVSVTATGSAVGIRAGWNVSIGQNSGPVSGDPLTGYTAGIISDGNLDTNGGSHILGNADAASATLGQNSRIDGYLTVAGSATFSSGATVGGTVTQNGAPLTFTKLSLPTPTSFSPSPNAADDRSIPNGGSLTLAPGTYRNLDMSGSSTLNISTGTYVFGTITVTGSSTINVDVTGGDVEIYTGGDVTLGTNVTQNVIGGSARNVYLETSGTFSTSSGTTWNGTIYATANGSPNASSVQIGGSNTVTGALYAREQVSLTGSTVVNCETADHFTPVPGTVTVTATGGGATVTTTYPYPGASPPVLATWTTTR